jgi:hypothetical protein
VKPILGRAALAVLLVPVLTACSSGGGDPAPATLPATSRATVAPSPVAGRYTGFTTPCPGGTQVSATDLYVGLVIKCTFGAQTGFPRFTSSATINKPLAAQGSPETAGEELFRKSKASATSATEDRAGLGDEAFLLVSNPGNLTMLVVRSANVVVQVSGHVDRDSNEAKEIAALRALEPRMTELAEALLAQLK